MFTPSCCIRNWFFVITLATLTGCAEEGPPLGPDESPSFAHGSGRAPVVEEFDSWDMTAWVAGDHPLGRGVFAPDHVSHDANGGEDFSGALILTLPAGTLNGAEIRSASWVAFRNVEVSLKTPDALETISAFFLYQLVPTRNDRNDEIDIEILNGTRKILFTTYVRGKQTNHWELDLGFDPSRDFYDYRIEWSPGRVRFWVDFPGASDPQTLPEDKVLEIDRITY